MLYQKCIWEKNQIISKFPDVLGLGFDDFFFGNRLSFQLAWKMT